MQIVVASSHHDPHIQPIAYYTFCTSQLCRLRLLVILFPRRSVSSHLCRLRLLDALFRFDQSDCNSVAFGSSLLFFFFFLLFSFSITLGLRPRTSLLATAPSAPPTRSLRAFGAPFVWLTSHSSAACAASSFLVMCRLCLRMLCI